MWIQGLVVQGLLTFLIKIVHRSCVQLLFPILDVLGRSPRMFCLFQFPINLRETDNSYFETQTQQIENSAKPVTTNSIFSIYALVWNLNVY